MKWTQMTSPYAGLQIFQLAADQQCRAVVRFDTSTGQAAMSLNGQQKIFFVHQVFLRPSHFIIKNEKAVATGLLSVHAFPGGAGEITTEKQYHYKMTGETGRSFLLYTTGERLPVAACSLADLKVMYTRGRHKNKATRTAFAVMLQGLCIYLTWSGQNHQQVKKQRPSLYRA